MAASVRSLLESAIDYAGLFPPAGLTMADAVRQHAAYLNGPQAWALGRFVISAARLTELEQAAQALWHPSRRWRISALIASPAEAAQCQAFNHRHGEAAIIDTVEVKAANADELAVVLRYVPTTVATYVEIPLSAAALLAHMLAAAGVYAKVRTGGVTAPAFPSCGDLAAFIGACAQARLPFKATAGLHHPLRRIAPFTYEVNSAAGTMHGFLNVFLAASFLWQGRRIDEVVPVLEESAVDGFRFDAQGVGWRDQRLDAASLIACRRDFMRSFGSCSFSEPLTELAALEILP